MRELLTVVFGFLFVCATALLFFCLLGAQR